MRGLLPHGLAGVCALLLGPMQFSDPLRQRLTKFHGIVGAAPAAIETIVWSCLAFSLLAADIVLQIQELRRSRPSTATTKAASAWD